MSVRPSVSSNWRNGTEWRRRLWTWRSLDNGHNNYVRRLPEEAPGRMAMRVAVDTRAGCRPDNNPQWKRTPPGWPRHTGPWWPARVRQEINTGISADAAWDNGLWRRPLQMQGATTQDWWRRWRWWCRSRRHNRVASSGRHVAPPWTRRMACLQMLARGRNKSSVVADCRVGLSSEHEDRPGRRLQSRPRELRPNARPTWQRRALCARAELWPNAGKRRLLTYNSATV